MYASHVQMQEPDAEVSAWNSDDEPQADDWYVTDRSSLNLFAFREAQLPMPPSTPLRDQKDEEMPVTAPTPMDVDGGPEGHFGGSQGHWRVTLGHFGESDPGRPGEA